MADDGQGTPTTPEQDDLAAYTALIPKSEPVAETPVEPTPEPEPETPETPEPEATQETTAEEPPAKKPEVKPEQRPGTPDEYVHKLSQKLSALQSQIDDLKGKKESQGGELTEAQEAKLAKATQQADELSVMLDPNYQPDLSESPKLAKRVLDQDARIAALEAEIRQTRESQKATTYWQEFQEENPTIKNGQAIYQGYIREAFESISPATVEALGEEKARLVAQDIADKNFFKHIEGLKKAAQPAPTKPAAVRPTAHRTPPTTPGGTRVTLTTGSQPRAVQSDTETTIEEYRALVPKD